MSFYQNCPITILATQLCRLKAGFHQRRSWSRSRNQKRRAYDLVKTAFRFRLRLRRLRFAYDLVKTRLSESQAEAGVLNQSQSVGTCIVIALFFCFLISRRSPNIGTLMAVLKVCSTASNLTFKKSFVYLFFVQFPSQAWHYMYKYLRQCFTTERIKCYTHSDCQ